MNDEVMKENIKYNNLRVIYQYHIFKSIGSYNIWNNNEYPSMQIYKLYKS